ncbi:hypothetical protein [uncultured Roseibium sp.]|nr:hypothetical protein [uncultured Roseibium sp.]
MVAQLARYLHQSILEIEDWEAPTFFRYFGHMEDVMAREAKARKPPSKDK